LSYKKLQIWQMSRELTIDIHRMTLTELPRFEQYETGAQIRRSMKSVRSNIVEGYGRRSYTNDYIKHLIYAQASNDETIDHLETLYETESLANKQLFDNLSERLNLLGKKLNKFIQAIQKSNQNS